MARKTFVEYVEGRFVHKVQYGPHAGIHSIFDNVEAFNKVYPSITTIYWKNAKRGEWMLLDDKRIAQCLNAYVLTNKKRQKVQVFKTCFGSFPLYIRKDGTSKDTMEYKAKSPSSFAPSSMSKDGIRRGKYLGERKKKFAQYVFFDDMEPAIAYMKAYKNTSVNYSRRQAMLIIQHDQNHIIRACNMIYKDKFNKLGLDEAGIAAIYHTIATSARSDMAKLEALKAILILRGDIAGDNGQSIPPPYVPNVVSEMSAPQELAPPVETAEFTVVESPKSLVERNAEKSANRVEGYIDSFKDDHVLPVFNASDL
jgi:hypothetical protein